VPDAAHRSDATADEERVDLTGGFDPARELVLPGRPDDPEMRDSVNVWLWDDGVDVGFPRIGVEAVGEHWDAHEIQFNCSFADGRVLTMWGRAESHGAAGADGRPRHLGTGPLAFDLVEPFLRWHLHLDGPATETSVRRQLDGWLPYGGDGEQVPVTLDVEIRSAAPPWECGTLREEAGRVLATQEEGAMMGGPRYEQLFRAEGRFTVDGRDRPIHGGGLRVRRTGVRRLATFRGHVWQSAVFPSGRAFGLNTYPERDDGTPTFNEGYVYEGTGRLRAARVVQAPWLRRLTTRPEEVTTVLELDDGSTTTITGTMVLPTYTVMPPSVGGGLNLNQAIATYTWDGETANGMLERSAAGATLTVEA